MRTAIVAVLLSLAVTNAWAADLEGGWKGTWTKDGDALQVTVAFEKTGSGYSGSFDSDALQVSDIPFSDISETNGKVHFLLKGDQSTAVFDGTLTDNAMSGTFTDGSERGTFELARATPSPAAIRTRNVTFRDKDVTLAGTLLLPAAPGRHAAILFLQGSGPEGRWANHYLAQKFAEAGVIALIYDKRGVGQSTGDWRKVGFDALADDAVAGIRFLQSQPEVDAALVGIYGHSQGGTVAPLVAVQAGDLRFIVASAAGGIDPAEVETYSVENSIGIGKLPPAERADAQSYVRELINVAFHGHDRALLDKMAAGFKDRAWYFPPPPPGDSYWLITKELAEFRPAQYWRRIKAPVLLVYGGHDERVPPRQSANAIQAALKSGGNRNVTLKWYARGDHTFTIVDPPQKTGWPRHVSNYANTLTGWVLSLKQPRKP
jgi:uncharacterized protein